MPSPLELLETKYGISKKKVDIDPLVSLEQKYNIPTIPTAEDPLEALEKKYAVRPTFADRLRPITERITPTLTKIAKWTGLVPLLPIAHPRVAKLFKEPAELLGAKYIKIEEAPGRAILKRLGFKEARSFIEKMPKIPETIGGIPSFLAVPQLFPKPTTPTLKKYIPKAYQQLSNFEREYQRQLGGFILDYMTSPTVWALWTIPVAFRIGGFKLQQRLTLNKKTLLGDIMEETTKRGIPILRNKYPAMSELQARQLMEEGLSRVFSLWLSKIGGLEKVNYLKMLRFAKRLRKYPMPVFQKGWKPPKPHYEFIKGHITGKAPSPQEARYATELKRIAITSTRAPGRMKPPIAPPTEVPEGGLPPEEIITEGREPIITRTETTEELRTSLRGGVEELTKKLVKTPTGFGSTIDKKIVPAKIADNIVKFREAKALPENKRKRDATILESLNLTEKDISHPTIEYDIHFHPEFFVTGKVPGVTGVLSRSSYWAGYGGGRKDQYYYVYERQPNGDIVRSDIVLFQNDFYKGDEETAIPIVLGKKPPPVTPPKKDMLGLGYTVEEIRGMKSGAEIRRIVANQIPAEEYRKPLKPTVAPPKPKVAIERPKPEIRIAQVLPKEARRIMTDEGSYTNGRWLIRKEFVPEKIKSKFEELGVEEKKANEKQVWATLKGEQPLSEPVGLIGEIMRGADAYVLKTKDGKSIAINKFFYDYFQKHINNFSLKANTENPELSPITIYSGDKKAGLIMPMRFEDEDVSWFKGVKPTPPKKEIPEASINRKKQIISIIDEIHKKAFDQVGSYTAIMAEDMKRYDSLEAELNQINKKLGHKTAKNAKTGESIAIHNAVRVGKPEGIFFSDIPVREFGEIKTLTWKDLKFENPVVFKDQWDATEKWFGLKERKAWGEEYRKLKEKAKLDHPLITLGDLIKQPEIRDFWSRLDQKIIDQAIEKGYDGIIYYHDKAINSGEYVDLTEGPPTPEIKPTTPEEEIMMNGGNEIDDYEAGGQQFPPTEEIVRRQAYERHIMQCLKSLAEMAPKDMVTNKQKALAHILAQKKKLTTRQLHRLEKIISDLTTMGPLTPTGRIKKTYMTKQQAGELIKALHKFFVPAYKKPSIPRGKLTAKDLQVIKTDLMRKPMRRVDVARLIRNARKVIRDPKFRPHFVNAYWEWVSSLKETAIGPKVLSMDMWSPRIERKTGLPIYSGIYLPFEDAARGLKVETMKFWKEIKGIWGEHLKSPEPEDGDLALRVHHALIGDEEYFVDAPLTDKELEIVGKCREFYDKYFTEFDIGNYREYYSPRIREAGGARATYAGRIPKELRFFAELERVGLLSPLIEDERILMRIYFYAGARKKYYGPVLKQASEIKRFLPPNTLDAVDGYIGQKLGYGTKGQRVLEKTMDNIMQSLKIELGPPQLLTALYFSSLYGGALGFRLHPIIRNSFQTFLMGYPEYGRWLAPGLKRSFWKGGISKWRNKGFLVDWGVPYGEEIDRAIEGVGSNPERLINLYRKFVRIGLIPYGKWIDTLNRCNMANACEARFNHWLKKYKDGKISLKRFAKKINLKGEDDFVQKEVINHIQNKNYEKALDRLIMVGIDNTQWPYRKGVGPQLGYGTGKFFSTFWVWPHRYAETIIGKWIARRQWGKIWRWLLVGYAMKKLGDKLKVSVLKWVHLGPLAISLTPMLNTFYHIGGIFKGASWGNKRELDEHWQDLKRSAPVFIGYGIFARNIYEFLKASENGFIYYDKKGRYRYQLTLTQALLKAGGFTPKGLQERRKLTSKFYNEEYSIKKAKRDINDMWATGRHAKAMKNYHKFLRRYYEVYIPLRWRYMAKYGKDYRLRTGKEVLLISPFIRTELKGIREQK